ncbi:MAG TPA: hypothetical protein PKZ40_02765, partial [Anaerolineaceae bacterium]|nr:hypothetical protein [Anaerolineaceae bacterium]
EKDEKNNNNRNDCREKKYILYPFINTVPSLHSGSRLSDNILSEFWRPLGEEDAKLNTRMSS